MPITPSVSLAPLSLLLPAVAGDTLSLNVVSLPVQIQAAVGVNTVVASVTSLDGTPAPILDSAGKSVGGQTTLVQTTNNLTGFNTFTGTLFVPTISGSYLLTIIGTDATPATDAGPTTPVTKTTPSLTLTVLSSVDEDVPLIVPPASVRVLRTGNDVLVEWATPTTPGFLGVRVMTSPDSSGVNTPFTQYGYLVTDVARSEMQTVLSSSTSQLNNNDGTGNGSAAAGGVETVTTTNHIAPINYSQADFPASTTATNADGKFYVQLTTIVQDPTTNLVYESYAVGPFECSYVDLRKIQPTDLSQGFSATDFATFLINNLVQAYPNLDLSPRSELRDLLIDPVAQELALAGTREWFIRASASVSALAQIDDATGSGISDPPATSAYKQMIAQGFRLTDDQVQAMIDTQFDILGELAGIDRESPTASIVDVLFYTMSIPAQALTVSLGAMVSTIPDANTPSMSFKAVGSGAMDPASINSYYLPDIGGWGFYVPCVCTSTGSLGNVGAGTIRTVSSGVQGQLQCTNPIKARYGLDTESNAHYAARIQDRRVAGVDTGSRLGYKNTAQAAAGVIGVEVVAAGDLEMLRDWLPGTTPTTGRHIYGCVDIYAQGDGGGLSQLYQNLPYTYDTQTEVVILAAARSASPGSPAVCWLSRASGSTVPLAAITQLYAEQQGSTSLSFYFNVAGAQLDPVSGGIFLDPDALTYTFDATGTQVFGMSNVKRAAGLNTSNYTLMAQTRTWSPLLLTPDTQPVLDVYSIIGGPVATGQTGQIPPSSIRLIKSQDIMLYGESSQATDTIRVDNTALPTKMLQTLSFVNGGPTTLDLGEGIILPISGGIRDDSPVGVVSQDGILYNRDATGAYVEKDYSVVPQGAYGHYAIKLLPGSAIATGSSFTVSFPRYSVLENLTPQVDTLALSGGAFTPLTQPGVVLNTWNPTSHGNTTLTADADLVAANVALASRYIKVMATLAGVPTVMIEGLDFILATDPISQVTSIAQVTNAGAITSRIPDGTTVTVTYLHVENFTVAYQFPQFIPQVVAAIENSRHAAADVLVKAMMENTVDLTFTVTLAPNATAAVVDPSVRTAVSAVFDNAETELTQSEIIYRVRNLPGVLNLTVPFSRMARSDGSYDLNCVIPTTQSWSAVDGHFGAPPYDGVTQNSWKPTAWMTSAWDAASATYLPKSVLRYKTMTSGGLPDSYVGLLYEGQPYRRCLTMAEFFAAHDLCFYIIGANDRDVTNQKVSSVYSGVVLLNIPGSDVANPAATNTYPGTVAYRVTYQVFGEVGPQDIPVGPMEYLRPGNITIDYISS